MALGVLAAASGALGSFVVAGGGSTSAIVYTCPAGISHAVVHVYGNIQSSSRAPNPFTLTSSAYMSVNGVGVGPVSFSDTGGQFGVTVYGPTQAGSFSLVLKPGDTVAASLKWYSSGGGSDPRADYNIVVSGYEVP